MPTGEEVKKVARQLEKDLADRGMIIAGGWAGFQSLVMPDNASPIQRREMEMAFFAGANHLFATMMNILDPGDSEPTERDLRRVSLIASELEAFETMMRKRYADQIHPDLRAKDDPLNS